MFYIFPPKGFTNLSTLEQDINTRFKLLLKLQESGSAQEKVTDFLRSSTSFNFEGLIEGSRRDCASHFIFRLACLYKGRIQDYWIQAEKRLFRYRLKSADIYSFHRNIVKLFQELNKLNSCKFFKGIELETFLSIFEGIKFLLKNEAIRNCVNRSHCEHNFCVPWVLVKTLVAERKVKVEDGTAVVPCIFIIDFLIACFEELLLIGISHIKSYFLKIEDSRLTSLFQRIHSLFINTGLGIGTPKQKICSESNVISSHNDVEYHVKNLPLCMLQLQSQLSKCNRLRHNERYRYSLFLKDAGLPLDQNIIFWKKYYSKPSKCLSSSCSHVWEGVSAKRFIYSIRHMYGQEGKRVSYCAHSCSSLQAMQPQPQEAGSCPFLHLEEPQLRKVLNESQFLWMEQIEEIVRASKDNNPSLACGYYLSALLHRHKSDGKKLARIPTYDPNAIYSLNSKRKENKDKLKRTKSLNAGVKTLPSYSGNISTESSKMSRTQVIQSCYDCNFASVSPELSFFSPVDYFRLTKKQLVPKKRLCKLDVKIKTLHTNIF